MTARPAAEPCGAPESARTPCAVAGRVWRAALPWCGALALLLAPALRAEPVTDLRKIVISEDHACAITHGGALRCAGSNSNGQLGTERKSLLLFTRGASTVLPAGVTDVAITGYLAPHTCAVVNRELFCWGSNEFGQLGTGQAGGNITTPTKSSVVRGVVTSVVVTNGSTCVILAPDGALQCWGRNYEGSIGGGAARDTVLQPITVIASGVTSVAMGGQHTCAAVDGGLKCWGFFLFKDGFKTELNPVSIIPPGQGVTAVAAARHTCVVARGSLQCWGRNFYSEVGVAEGPRAAPVAPTTIIASGVTQVALTDRNTCAVVEGEAHCWGDIGSGQLGTQSSSPSPTPVKLAVPDVPPASVDAVAVGMGQICVLTRAPGDGKKTLLQCTNRNGAPDDPDEPEELLPEADRAKWRAFGTEGIALAEARPRPVVRRIAAYGLWHGTIGAQPVVVLLSPERCGGARYYYYRKHARDIALTEKDRPRGGTWTESEDRPPSASWIFSEGTPDSRTLTGEWVSEDGQRRAPIRLELQASMKAAEASNGKREYECNAHDGAYDEPRIAQALQQRKVASKDTVFKGAGRSYAYRDVSLLDGSITGLSLTEAARLPRLRQMLADWERGAVSGYFECASMFSEAGSNPDFTKRLAPVFWNARLLVLEGSSGSYCGGAHPNYGLEDYKVWNLRDDQPVNVARWLIGGSDTKDITSKRLLKLVASRYGRRAEPGPDSCAGVLDGNVTYFMYPSSEGMVFYPSLYHAARACEEPITVPWARMRPFLSPEGEQAVRTLVGK